VGVLSEDGSEEGGTGGQDELVSLDLSCPNTQGAVEKIFLLSYFPKSHTDVAFKIVPAKTKFLAGTHRCNVVNKGLPTSVQSQLNYVTCVLRLYNSSSSR